MTVHVTPHLNFRGDARAALDFYATVFGGEPQVSTYADAGAPADAPGAEQVVFGQVQTPAGFSIMAFDVPADRPWSRGEDPFFVSVRGGDAEEITRYWAGLSEGATVRAPLAASQWSPLYGMLADRFGVTWVLDVA